TEGQAGVTQRRIQSGQSHGAASFSGLDFLQASATRPAPGSDDPPPAPALREAVGPIRLLRLRTAAVRVPRVPTSASSGGWLDEVLGHRPVTNDALEEDE